MEVSWFLKYVRTRENSVSSSRTEVFGVRADCAERFYSNSGNCLECPIHCKFCDSAEKCFQCDNGYSGANCMKQCDNCKPNTICTIDKAVCVEACKDGLSGQFCDKPCASRCRSCSRNDTSRCFPGKSNKTVEIDCPEDCRSQKCNGSKGSLCSNGCSPGYGGESCSRKCPEYCNADTSGDKVTESADSHKEADAPMPDTSGNKVPESADGHKEAVPVLLILVVTPLGVVLVILGVVLSVMLWRRRRSRHQDDVASKKNRPVLWANIGVDHVAQQLSTTDANSQAEARNRESLYPYNMPFC